MELIIRDTIDFFNSIGIQELIEVGLFLCWVSLLALPVNIGRHVSYMTYCLFIVSCGLILFYVVPMKHVKTPERYEVFFKSSLIMFAVASIRWFHLKQSNHKRLLLNTGAIDGKENYKTK